MPVNAEIVNPEQNESIFSEVEESQDKKDILPESKPKSTFGGFTFGMPVVDNAETKPRDRKQSKEQQREFKIVD